MNPEDKPRASPEALLAKAEREGRGRLRVFLGAAPGVGKTYAMLQAAQAERAGGRDVAVGIVETHGRAETEAMLKGLDVLPRRPILHRGHLIPEFDLEGALARRPRLLLVDEYAHSNVPGSRHPKRWQDVRELLGAGIDVWTTLNIQHLESLNEVVQRISGVRVRETVPDTALGDADEVIMVDLPPDELLKRLAEGKVYVQDTAARAIERFFKPSNLTALRELALRRVAATVDCDLVEHMQSGAIEGPWAAGERILVCVGPDASAPRVVREAKRLADMADAPWFAVTVERPGAILDAGARQKVNAALRLAESLGAETRALVGRDIVAEVLRVARFENVTQIVVAQVRPARLSRPFVHTLADALVREARGIGVHVITFAGEAGRPQRRLPPPGGLEGYVAAVAAVAAATVAGEFLTRHVALPNVSMIYLLAVLFPAILFGVWPAVTASLLSALAYNFFFIDPVYTFTIARPHELLALAIFLLIAVLMSAVAGRAREQAKASTQRVRASRRLYDFTRKLLSLAGAEAIAEGAASETNAILARAVVILLPGRDGLALAAAWPPEDRLDTASLSAARWTHERNEPAGATTGTLPSVPWLFLPLRGRQGGVGVLGIETASGPAALDSEARVLLEALAAQVASALERAALAQEMAGVRSAAEAERVRNILLASISHDFRTPLSSILGAASSLMDYGERIDPEQRRDLLSQIREEADHLDGMVRNLLAMTRLEAGALDLRRDWVDLAEVLNQAVATARRRGATQHFMVLPGEGVPLVHADQILLNQVLGNVVGNAVRYAGGGATVQVAARKEGNEVVVSVTDDGPGIPAPLLEHVFEKFVRAASDRADGGEGAGLGLAIAKGIVEAHGGTIRAESPVPGRRGGARISFRLPVGGEDAA